MASAAVISVGVGVGPPLRPVPRRFWRYMVEGTHPTEYTDPHAPCVSLRWGLSQGRCAVEVNLT